MSVAQVIETPYIYLFVIKFLLDKYYYKIYKSFYFNKIKNNL